MYRYTSVRMRGGVPPLYMYVYVHVLRRRVSMLLYMYFTICMYKYTSVRMRGFYVCVCINVCLCEARDLHIGTIFAETHTYVQHTYQHPHTHTHITENKRPVRRASAHTISACSNKTAKTAPTTTTATTASKAPTTATAPNPAYLPRFLRVSLPNPQRCLQRRQPSIWMTITTPNIIIIIIMI
jgi:hypothetical protein